VKRSAVWLAAVLLALGCDGPTEPSYSIELNGLPGLGVAGDTLHMTAREHLTDRLGVETSIVSTDYPDQFEWSSSNPAIAEFVSKGVLVMKTGGQVGLTVRTIHAEYAIVFTIGVKPTVIIKTAGSVETHHRENGPSRDR
jgi:hypothetical protein